MKRRVSVAVSSYDHVHDLLTGRVRAEGLDLVFLEYGPEEIFQRFARQREWDVSEFSLALYVAMRSRGDDSLIGIPVFPSRVFRHSSIYTRAGHVDDPSALSGCRVGVSEWVQTAGVWARGILEEQYGVDIAAIEWIQAGTNEPGRAETVNVTLPAGVTCTPRPDASLDRLLTSGEIDAVISARPPESFLRGEGVVRLIRDHVAVEQCWWKDTAIFPIMHLIVVRRDVYEETRWIAQSLVAAFTEAKRLSVARLRDAAASHVAVPWISDRVAEITPLFGEGSDYWPYGVEQNRTTLEAFVRFAVKQGIAAPDLAIESLFAPETEFEPRV